MTRRNNKLEHCFRSLTVLTWSTTKCTAKPVGKKLDRLAIEFEATAFKAAFCSLFFEVTSQPCQHWRTHYIPLSPPLRISFWAWADRRANNTHAFPDVRDLRTSGNCCYQSPPFRRPRDQKKRRLWGREWVRRHLLFLNALQSVFKRVIYIVRKILSRGMKDYNEFTHISNTVDIYSVCRDFGWGYINDQSANRTR